MILFADADGATKFSDLAKLESGLKDIVKGNDNFENILCRFVYVKWFRSINVNRFKNMLTPWSTILEKLIVTQIVKKFSDFYVSQKFIIMFTEVHSWSLWRARSIALLLFNLCLNHAQNILISPSGATCHIHSRQNIVMFTVPLS